MFTSPDSITDIAGAIQLALAPAFLLTGLAGLLNVMTGRLTRIIDRGRKLAEREPPLQRSERQAVIHDLEILELRRYLTSVAITACTIAALMTCIVFVTIFIDVVLHAPLSWLIGTLFTGATLALVVGLIYFLREVHLATKTVRIPLQQTASSLADPHPDGSGGDTKVNDGGPRRDTDRQ